MSRFSISRLILSLALSLLAPGCAWIPSEGQRVQLSPAPNLDVTLSTARQGETLTPRRGWPQERWWRQFGSAELDRIMEVALKDNPSLKEAAARLRHAQALARVEGARLLPFLDAAAGVESGRFSGNGANVVLRGQDFFAGFITPLSLRYQFDFWGKYRAALDAALGEAEAEAAEAAGVRLQLTAAIARTYFRGVALRRQLELAQGMIALQRDLLEVFTTRFELGLDSADPVQQATADLEAAVKREAVARDQLNLQRHLLARLLGRGPDGIQDAFSTPAVLPERIPLPAKLPVELLAHRPDLTSALHRAEAAAQRIKVAKASFLPTVDLTAFVGLSALRLTKGASSLASLLFSGSSFTYGIAPGVRLPIFEGGRLRGELSAQRVEYDGAVELYNKTLVQAVQEVADSLSTWQQSRSVVEAQQRLLASQREALALAEDRLHSGLDDRRVALTRQNSVLNQEFALKSLETDQLVAMADLIEALGGGYGAGPADTRIAGQPD